VHTDNRPLDSVAAASEQVATPLNSDKLIGVQLRNEANNLVVFNFASPTGWIPFHAAGPNHDLQLASAGVPGVVSKGATFLKRSVRANAL